MGDLAKIRQAKRKAPSMLSFISRAGPGWNPVKAGNRILRLRLIVGQDGQ
jgi:hypothetical protein